MSLKSESAANLALDATAAEKARWAKVLGGKSTGRVHYKPEPRFSKTTALMVVVCMALIGVCMAIAVAKGY